MYIYTTLNVFVTHAGNLTLFWNHLKGDNYKQLNEDIQ